MKERATPPPELNTTQDTGLRRHLYLLTLCLIVPAALLTIQVAFPTPGPLRTLALSVTAGWAALLLGLLLNLLSNRVVEWGTYLLGAFIFLAVLIADLLQWRDRQPMAFLGAAQLLSSWAFLTFGDRRGLRLAVAFYLLTLALGLVFALPFLLSGTFQSSHLGAAWRIYVYYYALAPVYIAITSGMAVLHRNLSQRRIRELSELAYLDPLTTLPNRRAFQEELHTTLDNARKHHRQAALCVLNVNDFAQVNDEFGHAAGDHVLQQLAQRWNSLLPEGTHLSRVSADEFALIVPDATPTEVNQLVQDMLTAGQRPLNIQGHRRTLSLRCGVALFPQHGLTRTELNVAADLAQAEAQRAGKPIMHYAPALAAQAERRRRILTALQQAPEREELSVVYQPIVSLNTGQLQSLEALMRWNSPVQDPPPTPDEFIALAEENDLIRPLGQWTFQTVLKQVQTWQAQGLNVPRINLNVAPQELLTGQYAQRVLKELHARQINPRQLELELTERTVLESAAVKELQVLLNAGVHISIDDFGTGHSSLGRLHTLPITGVKLDREFTSMLGQDSSAERLAASVLALARAMKLEVVAEGIETAEQLTFLRDLGCPLGQGYYFQRPAPAHEITRLLRETQDHDATEVTPGREPSADGTTRGHGEGL